MQPARAIEPAVRCALIETKDGRLLQGLVLEQTEGVLVLRDAQNRATRIAATEIERQATQPASLMPEGLLRDLTAQQAADLLEFLSSLKSR